MEVNFIFKHKIAFFISLFLFVLFSFINYNLFLPLYKASEVIITYGIHPFDICIVYPKIWIFIKKFFIFLFLYNNFLFCRLLYLRFFSLINFNFLFKPIVFINSIFLKYLNLYKNKNLNNLNTINNKFEKNINENNQLSLFVGNDYITNLPIRIPESGLYQNFLITGTIGSGKTSSAIYPFLNQFLEYSYNNNKNKIGMLILDVKGNFHKYVLDITKKYGLEKDVIVISLKNNISYNPLDKPNLKPQVLANRLKTVLTLFSENNSESYWLDKAEQVLSECIKLCRLYNNGYVTFLELHKLISIPEYYLEKINYLRDLFLSSKLSDLDIYELNSSLNFFEKEFNQLDPRTKNILISEITRITNTFISDYDVFNTFCPDKESLNFSGFSDVIKNGKIVVLDINISEYTMLAKIIATYLKLDFQTEVMSFLANGKQKKSLFICDEYDKFCTKTDADFFSMSREAKCINIVATQSYSSLKNSLKDESSVKVVTQNLVNKIWFRTDDVYTIEEAQKLLGKEDKEKLSKSISESAKETNYSYFTNSLNSKNSNISETYSTFTQHDFIFDTNFFTRNLETFSALAFLSDGKKCLDPKKIKMIPYFKNI